MNDLPLPAANELANLLESLCLGEMTLEEADRIEELTRDDEPCLRYILFMHMHALAERYCGANAALEAEQLEAQLSSLPVLTIAHEQRLPSFISTASYGTTGYLSSGWPVAYLIATVVFGVGALIGAFTYVSHPGNVIRDVARSHLGDRQQKEFVGVITGAVNCKWLDSSLPTSGRVVLEQQFALSSGLLEVTYETGAKVILQGPVTYKVESNNGGFLSIGKLTGRITERSAKGFTIRTPTAVVTDLGTEFGVNVDERGDTETHIYSGVVEVKAAGDVDGGRQAVRLYEGQSIRVRAVAGKNVVLTPMAAAPKAFVRVEQFLEAAKVEKYKRFHLWLSASEQRRHDPSLLAYYDFQKNDGAPQVLYDVAHASGQQCNGAVFGDLHEPWTAGHTPGKEALSFKLPTDYVRVDIPQQTDNATFFARLRIASLNNRCNNLLASQKDCGSYAGAVLNDHPKAYWRFGETSGGFQSAVGGGCRGEVVNWSLIRAQYGPPAAEFPGLGSDNRCIITKNPCGERPTGFVVVDDDIRLAPYTKNWTVEAWIMTTTDYAASDCEGYIVCKKDGVRNGYGLQINTRGKACFSFAKAHTGEGGAEVVNVASSSALSLGVWHHLVGTVERGYTNAQDRLTIYVDGQLAAETVSAVTFGAIVGTSARLTIGALGDPRFGYRSRCGFNGLIDEVAIYDHALTPDQIAAHYRAARVASRSTAGSDDRTGRVCWQIASDGTISLTNGIATYKSDPIISARDFRRWLNIAVVYDRNASQVSFYCDGRPVGKREIGEHSPMRIGTAWIGSGMPDGSEDDGECGFCGQIDELAIFNRALTAAEIRQMSDYQLPGKIK